MLVGLLGYLRVDLSAKVLSIVMVLEIAIVASRPQRSSARTRNSTTSIPQATYMAVGFIGVVYVITTWLLVSAYGPSKAVEAAVANPTGMFVDGMVNFVRGWAAHVLSVLVVTSAFAAVLSCQNFIARYCFSLGADRVLPAVLGRAHPRHGSPYVASLLLTVIFVVGTLAFSGTDPNCSYD